MSHPLISIVIPTCNRSEDLQKCLDALFETYQLENIKTDVISSYTIKYQSQIFEIIVANDGLDIQLDFQHQFRQVRLISGPKKGPAANRNSGATYARGEWILFIDDDCIADKRCIIEYIKCIQSNPDCDAIEGCVLTRDTFKGGLETCPLNTHGNCFWSANILIKKTIFQTLGGFDETFRLPRFEDAEFFLRLKNFGAKISFASQAIVYHGIRKYSLGSLIMYESKSSYYKAYLNVKHLKTLFSNSFIIMYKDELVHWLRMGYRHLKQINLQFLIVDTYMFFIGTVLILVQALYLKLSHKMNFKV